MAMSVRNLVKAAALVSLLGVFVGLGALYRGAPVVVYVRDCACPPIASSNITPEDTSLRKVGVFHINIKAPSQQKGRTRLLSYQPPGNGWNNQRIALENALVLAKLLNRTLMVHPLAPHELGGKLKAGRNPGYVAYNMLNESNLLPLSYFMDLELMSQLVPVISVNTSHTKFIQSYSHLSWRNICHSSGFGYWVDQVPQLKEEVDFLSNQRFVSLGGWKKKCPEEQERAARDPSPIVKFVSDLVDEEAEMLYFEQGTLFGIHIRFTTFEGALAAQNWVLRHVRYSRDVWKRVEAVASRIGTYNAIQVRRKDHMDRKLLPSYWLDRMLERNFSKEMAVYVATDQLDLSWFKPFTETGFRVYFSIDFPDIFNFTHIAGSLRQDFLGVHEQSLCERAVKFVPSPASTFDAFILRHRGEVKMRDGLMIDSLHTYWIRHQLTGGEIHS